MGIISRHNQTLKDLRVKIQSLNEEATNTLDLLEQQEKFDKIQQADNDLKALYEAQTMAKKELREFRPIVQTYYLQMHQVDAIADS